MLPHLINWSVAVGVIVFVVLLLSFLALRELLRRNDPLPYRAIPSLLTNSEAAFFRVLFEAIDELPVVVFSKVRLLDLMEIPRGTEGRAGFRARVQSKHVDFVLCDAATLRPMLVIELDDPSHRRKDRMRRDAFVDEVMRTIGLAIWHVPVAAKYDVMEFKTAIASSIKQVK
jgi:Protein of unknown function (DUF2726)